MIKFDQDEFEAVQFIKMKKYKVYTYFYPTNKNEKKLLLTYLTLQTQNYILVEIEAKNGYEAKKRAYKIRKEQLIENGEWV